MRNVQISGFPNESGRRSRRYLFFLAQEQTCKRGARNIFRLERRVNALEFAIALISLNGLRRLVFNRWILRSAGLCEFAKCKSNETARNSEKRSSILTPLGGGEQWSSFFSCWEFRCPRRDFLRLLPLFLYTEEGLTDVPLWAAFV